MTAAAKVYLDTNVFIAAYEQSSARADHARWLLDAIEDGRIVAATSELTLAELLVKPLQSAAADIVGAYTAIIQDGPGFEVAAVARSILIEAAQVRAERLSIRLPDAIHVATARRLGCTCIVSGDGRLSSRGGPVSVPLGPYSVDDVQALPR